jgi:hypothetical protein
MKVSQFLQVQSQKYDETGSHKDCQMKGRLRVTFDAENNLIRVNCT